MINNLKNTQDYRAQKLIKGPVQQAQFEGKYKRNLTTKKGGRQKGQKTELIPPSECTVKKEIVPWKTGTTKYIFINTFFHKNWELKPQQNSEVSLGTTKAKL